MNESDKKPTKEEIGKIFAEALARGAKAVQIIDIINKFDAYVPDYQLAEMNIPHAWDKLEQCRDERRDIKSAAREGAKEGVQKTLPKVYAKTATMSDEELRESTKPKTRKPGGGRKKTKDIDDKQVKAVLDDMKKNKRESFRAHSDYIILTMKDGDYTNPYSTPKDLDTAVRRYCERHNITPSALTNHTGKWRSTK